MVDQNAIPADEILEQPGEEMDPVTERFEILEQAISNLRTENATLSKQLDILGRVVIAQEKSFETRSRASVRKTLESLLYLMEHQDQYIAEASNMSGITGPNQDIRFTLTMVDGEKEKETSDSFFCTKLEDGSIGLSYTSTPDVYVEGRGDHIKAFLANKDFLFQGTNRRLFNYHEEKITQPPAPAVTNG